MGKREGKLRGVLYAAQKEWGKRALEFYLVLLVFLLKGSFSEMAGSEWC